MLGQFKTAKGEKLSKEELITELKKFISEDKQKTYRILVGTDSEAYGKKIDFITVIVVHRVGIGARYFWRREVVFKNLGLYDRLWNEAILSLNVAQRILKILTNEKLDFQFEVHLDLSTNGKSSSTVKEIINLVRSYGFEVRIKPDSYAASKIADRLI
jgi:hypothetical protein